jgi:hypothetical protein
LRPKTPGHPAIHPRRFHSDEIEAHRRGLREEYRVYNASQCAKADAVKGDTAKFFREICRLKPFTYQLELAELYRKNQFLAVRWPRQTGKSTSIGGLLLQDAYENPDLNIGFIGPSWRQTKLNLRREQVFAATFHLEPTTSRKPESASKTAQLSKLSPTIQIRFEATLFIDSGGMKQILPQVMKTSMTPSCSRWAPPTAS